MSSPLYICFKPADGYPFLSVPSVPGCNCQLSSNFKSDYLFYSKQYSENLIRATKIDNYYRYHRFASYGKQRMSKRILAPYCGDIYNFRRNI
jgi:hypothetical protein